jgi:hypothetical protein
MTNKPYRKTTSRARRGVIAASLIGAAGFVSLTAQADPASAPVAPAPVEHAAAQPDATSDALVAGKPQVFETAPSLPKSVLGSPAPGVGAAISASEPSSAVPAAGAALAASAGDSKDGVPWVLDVDTRPGLINYAALNPLNGLYFTLPTATQARIMLPGNAADAASQARYVIQRYITDNIGSAAQARARQLEAITNWVDQTGQKKKLLPKDPWAAYEFNREALSTLQAFKDKVDHQSAPTIARMTTDVQGAVSQIAPIMEATGGYEQKMLWYTVLVQLKEGINLYQARVTDGDHQVQEVIAGFERDNPPVVRPQSDPPPEPNLADGPLARRTAPLPKPSLTPATADVQRELAQPPVAKQESTSSTGGVIVVLLMLAVVVGLFFKLRKRVSNKGSKPESNS